MSATDLSVPALTVRQIGSTDVECVKAMLRMFGHAFEDAATYHEAVPSDAYLADLLAGPTFVAVVAVRDEVVVGGLAAYELVKFERERKELYIYDLAVAEAHRRQGIGTALIRCLQRIAAERGAHSIYVQADVDDAPAIALYRSLGTEIIARHFDFDVPGLSD